MTTWLLLALLTTRAWAQPGEATSEAASANGSEPGDSSEAPEPPADTPIVLLQDATPVYPAGARERGIQGDVLLALTVDETGRVTDTEVLSSPDEMLSLASLDAAHALRFQPATHAGEPVAVQLQYRFRFNLGIADQGGNDVPGSLYGQVVDPDGLGVPGVRVLLSALDNPDFAQKSLSVKDDGTFLAGFLPSGRYLVRMEHAVFNVSEFELQIVRGETLERAFTLYPSGAVEIVVSYQTQTWREVERAPLETNEGTVTGSYTLTRRDIEANPGSMEDVARAVHSLPGIVSDGDMLATFHARGGDSDDVVFMLDRVPLSNPFHLAGFNSMFNPDMISEVDFFAGAPPADVPAGTSAVLAVKSWEGTPREDSFEMDGAIDISASSLRAHAMGPVGENASFALAARRSYMESYFQVLKWVNVLDTAFAAPEFSELSARYAWQPDGQHRLVATAMRSGDSLGIIDSDDESVVNVEGSLELDNNLSLFSLDHKFTASETLTIWSTTAWTFDQAFIQRDMGGDFSQDVSSHRWFGRTDVTKTLDQTRLAGGVDMSWYLVQAEGSVPDARSSPTWNTAPIASYDQSVLSYTLDSNWGEASGYLQGEWDGPVRLRLGGRATYAGATEEFLISPRAGLSLPLPTGTVPKASWGIYHQAPRDPLQTDPDLGNPDLRSERATHYVLGLDQGFPLPGEDAGGLFRVEAYRIDLSDLIVNPDTDDAVASGTHYTNQGTGQSQGADLLLGMRHSRLQGMVTYSLLFTERTNPLNERFDQSYAPGQDQRHTLGATVEYQATPRWRTTARYSFHSGRPTSAVALADNPDNPDTVEISCLNCERLGDYHAIDLRAEWRKAMDHYRLTFYAEVLNVTNFKSDFVPIVTIEDGVRTDSMLRHLPTRPFLGVRADF